VSGVQVPLGLRRPETKPYVRTVDNYGISNFFVTEETGGSINKDTAKYYRIAIETEEGVLPPTNAIYIKASANNALFHLTWDRGVFSDLKSRQILIFAGDTTGMERRIGTVPATQEYYLDSGASGTSGELASVYDIDIEFQYCYTYARNVRGMEDESGPSPLSPTLRSNNARKVSVSPTEDGFFNTPNLKVADGSNTTTMWINPLELEDLHNTWDITGFETDINTGYVKVTINNSSETFTLLPGDFVKFTDVVGADPATSYEIMLEPDPEIAAERIDKDMRWLKITSFLVDAPIDVGQTITTPSVRREVISTFKAVTVDHATSTVVFEFTEDHCFYTDQVVTTDAVDHQVPFKIVVSPFDRRKVYLPNASFDRAAENGGYGTIMKLHQILIYPPSGYESYFDQSYSPYDGDMVAVDIMDSTGELPVKGTYRARTGGLGAFLIDDYLASSYSAVMDASSFTFVPHNDYIYARRVYRIGDSGEFLKVKDMDPWEEYIVDAKPTSSLGEPITSNYQSGGIDVTFDVPPVGMTNITSHYDMKFGIYGNSVRWTENGYPDAWAENFVQDFKYKPLNIISYDQSVVVFCEDQIYELVGNTSTSMSVSVTSAVDGCIAGGSVQSTGAGIIYLSRRGLMLYRGGSAQCITDTRIFPSLFRGTSGASGLQYSYYYYWTLSRHSYLYQNLANSDQRLSYVDHDPVGNVGTVEARGVINEIKSFYENGRYYMYWSTVPSRNKNLESPNQRYASNYAMHSTIVVDTFSEGMPIVTLGFKPRDVFVTENEDVYFLADNTGESSSPPA
jgi:hypothetical protein